MSRDVGGSSGWSYGETFNLAGCHKVESFWQQVENTFIDHWRSRFSEGVGKWEGKGME